MLEFYEANIGNYFNYKHAEYNYAKIELVNNYLEIFENTVNYDKSVVVVQNITNIIRSKPILNFHEEYFSKSFAFATRAMNLHSNLMEETLNHIISTNREWIQKFAIVSGIKDLDNDLTPKHYKASGAYEAENDGVSTFSSHLEVGLPRASSINPVQSIIMHHPGILVEMTG